MAKRKVTLQSTMKRGTFYWVCDVNAESDDEAVVAAENLFANEMENSEDWTFTDYNVE